ncbi:MAG: ABC transporter ATP-binding protein [Balneolaceae bacterium]|jgi:putative ABC transport system ATP-binding protein|nr:ABC transporter ATP-binding protein [Balneolaceae bacterium]
MKIVDLKGITRVYRSGALAVEALRGIDLQFSEGEFATIMGPSGSGKSTLMNMIGCLDQPTAGSYYLNGEDVSRFDKSKLAGVRNRTLGFVFQSFHLLPRTTALENVELPLLYNSDNLSWKDIHRRARKALEIVGLGDRTDHNPNELSGGQQQRVAIARALVSRPKILLADEPTGNLDSRTSLEIMDLFQKLNQDGLTILMVTHEPEVAAFSERIVTLRDGLLRSDKKVTPANAKEALANWIDQEDLELENEMKL